MMKEVAAAAQNITPSDLPAPPKEAIRIVQACSRSDIDSRVLAGIVANDPVLTAELLRVANSAFFGPGSRVKSVARAVTILGNRTLRNLVLCISMRDVLHADSIPGFDIDAYWEAALHRAVSARSLASLAALDADECFTAGLLQDLGLLVMLYLVPDRVQHWPALAQASPEQRRDLEIQLFHTTHDEIGLLLATSWGLPSDLTLAMGYHHVAPPADSEAQDVQLCRVASCADWMAAAYRCEDKRQAIQKTRTLLKNYFDLDPGQSDSLLEGVSESLTEAASAMGIRLREPIRFDRVLREANLRLAEENLSYQELTWRLEQTLAERNRIAEDLNRELELAREVQQSLLPDHEQWPAVAMGINFPARTVSGDFYDYFQLADGRIAFCMADVSGKGMHAALLMAKTASLFRCLGKSIHDPGKLLGLLNREIAETAIRGMFVTMVAGVVEPLSGQVALASAGHLPVLHMRYTTLIREYPAQAPPLGITDSMVFPSNTFALEGGCLYLYTDGLLEARQGNGRLGKEGLLKLLEAYADLPIESRTRAITDAVVDGSRVLDDDLTLVIIEGARSVTRPRQKKARPGGRE